MKQKSKHTTMMKLFTIGVALTVANAMSGANNCNLGDWKQSDDSLCYGRGCHDKLCKVNASSDYCCNVAKYKDTDAQKDCLDSYNCRCTEGSKSDVAAAEKCWDDNVAAWTNLGNAILSIYLMYIGIIAAVICGIICII